MSAAWLEETVRWGQVNFNERDPAEMDVGCLLCGGSGCPACKGTGWMEVLGCGMVHPAVIVNCGLDAERYTGFAFGMGPARITMLRHGITDIRQLYEGDMRFLRQFGGAQ